MLGFYLVVCVLIICGTVIYYRHIPEQPCPPHDLHECVDEETSLSPLIDRFREISDVNKFKVTKRTYRGHICTKCGARFIVDKENKT